jgi:pimeloyl-ACP methyl ester carboxylesterase
MPRIITTLPVPTALLVASLSLFGCGDSEENEDNADDASSTHQAGTHASGGAGGGSNSAGGSGSGPSPLTSNSSSSAKEAPTDESASAAFSGSFDACIAALKPSCTYEQKATPCASLRTPKVPLSNGETWGDNEVKAGPYGGFVAWNQGKDFANPVAAGESTCNLIASAFGEPQPVTQDILNLRGQDLSLYTIFRPACMKDGEKYPVITWGNGTCGQSGGYATLLATVASHGFVVIASNSRFTDGGNKEMLKALDLAKALNDDPDSLYHNRLDLDKIGAMGHSQGSSATAHAATDPRIKAAILFNAGLASMDKPFLAVSGDRDITSYTPADMAKAVESAAQPGAWLFYHKVLETGGNVTGHLTLMEQPERVTTPTVAWWKYMLQGDEEAKKMFVGDDCGLCTNKDDHEFGQRGLK